MKRRINKTIPVLFIFILVFLLATGVSYVPAAAAPLDEIVDYEIDADINEDATVNLKYHIEWKVLDSDSEGPLSWVKVGVPNNHCSEPTGLTDNIKKIEFYTSNESYVRIDFDREYYKDEIAVFEFSVVQDYLYQVNKLEEGYTQYSFTPGWFDGIAVDDMTVRWNADKAESWKPECFNSSGYLEWNKKGLEPGEKFTVKVSYPNDAYGFDVSKKIPEPGSSSDDEDDWIYGIIGVLCFIAFPGFIIYGIVRAVNEAAYQLGATFGSSEKITRKKIVYFDACPGCGAPREEGKKKCDYCGRSLIKSEEIIKEKDLKAAEKEALKFSKKGEYRYTSDPNTFIMVNVTKVSPPRRSHSSGRSHHSSCAHSSCACACACACAGGGRAGCSTKDFYRTNLRLRWLK